MRKLLVAALFTLGWGLVAAAPAVAAESHSPFCGLMTGAPVLNCTFTETLQGQVSVDTHNVNPCSGVVGTATMVTNESLNNQNTVVHDNGNIVLNGSDGSQILLHLVDHFSISASGAVNQFSIASMACP